MINLFASVYNSKIILVLQLKESKKFYTAHGAKIVNSKDITG